MRFANPDGVQGDVVSPAVNELIIPNYRQTRAGLSGRFPMRRQGVDMRRLNLRNIPQARYLGSMALPF